MDSRRSVIDEALLDMQRLERVKKELRQPITDAEWAIIITRMEKLLTVDETYRRKEIDSVLHTAYFSRARINLTRGDIKIGLDHANKYFDTNPPQRFRKQIETLISAINKDDSLEHLLEKVNREHDELKRSLEEIKTASNKTHIIHALALTNKVLSKSKKRGEILNRKGYKAHIIIEIEKIRDKNIKLLDSLIMGIRNELDKEYYGAALTRAKAFLSLYPRKYDKSNIDYDRTCDKYRTQVQDIMLLINLKRSDLNRNSPARGIYHSDSSALVPRDTNPIKSMTFMTFGKKPRKKVSASEHIVRPKKFTHRKK